VVVVVAGVNDIHQKKSIEEIQENLKLMHERAKENKIDFLLCTILPYDIATPEAFEKIQSMNAWILNYSKENKLPSCDTFKATSHPKSPRMLISSADHIHPDAETYKKMAEPIEDALNALEKNNVE
jgi:lysophospholipase L1-like esterase